MHRYEICVCVCFYHLAECDETHKSSGRNETQGKLQRLLDRGRGEGGGGGIGVV